MIRTAYTHEPLLDPGAARAQLGYHSARVATREGRHGTPGDHKAHTRLHRKQLINLSRAYRRDNPIYQGSILRSSQFVVGSGFQLQVSAAEEEQRPQSVPTPGQITTPSPMEAWCLDVERQWREWWGTNSKRRSREGLRTRRMKPDVRQILSGPRIEALMAREVLTCGDTGFALLGKPGEERVQAFEAEQITGSTAKDDDGIDKDDYGQPKSFNVCPYSNGQVDHKKAKAYEAKDFLFVTADPERASAIRCVPPLQASFATLDRLSDICDAEAVAWQIQARMALILRRDDGPPIADSVSRPDPASNDPEGKLSQDRISELDLALIFHAGPKETAEGMERTAPSKNFRESFRELVRVAGLPINMALEFMLLDFSEDNYSQTRALVALFVDWIVGWQLGLASQFHDPLFDWWLSGRIEANLIPPPPADFEVSWICPAFPGIDLRAETEASESQIRLGLRSWSAAVKGNNGDPDSVRKQKERDRIEAIRSAKRVEDATGVKTDWQGFCGEPREAVKAAPAPAGRPQPGDEDEPEQGDDQGDEDEGVDS